MCILACKKMGAHLHWQKNGILPDKKKKFRKKCAYWFKKKQMYTGVERKRCIYWRVRKKSVNIGKSTKCAFCRAKKCAHWYIKKRCAQCYVKNLKKIIFRVTRKPCAH